MFPAAEVSPICMFAPQSNRIRTDKRRNTSPKPRMKAERNVSAVNRRRLASNQALPRDRVYSSFCLHDSAISEQANTNAC